jgi:hypothetical protein
MAKQTKKTFDVLDAGISDKYNAYIASLPEMRERFFTESFWLDAPNWEKYHAQLAAINFNWKEFKYSEITVTNQIENIITTDETGIYMLFVKPINQIYDMPKFVLYVGIAGENNKSRPVRERLKDYFNFNSIKKRDAIIRLLQKYYKNTYIAYSLLNANTTELKRIETALLGYFYPKPNKDDFPLELKPIKKSF